MTRSKRLAPVKDIMDDRTQHAAEQWARSRNVVDEQEAKLQQLISYRADYHLRFHNTLKIGAEISRIHDFQLFLNRLDVAIEQQRARVKHCEEECERMRLVWMQQRMKSKAVETVVDRYRKQENAAADKREQKEFDELAQRSGRKKKDEEEL